MKNISSAALILSCSLTMTLPAVTYAADSMPARSVNADNGQIIFLDKDGLKCTLPLPPPTQGRIWQYELYNLGNGCVNNRAQSVVFTHIPSATKILLTDTSYCSKTLSPENPNEFDKNAYWIELRTTKNFFTSPEDSPLTLETIANTAKNKIVVPGLQMLDNEIRGGVNALVNSLSCVRITTSAPNITPAASPPIQLSKQEWRVAGDYLKYKLTCEQDEVVADIKRTGGNDYKQLISCQKILHGTTPLKVTNDIWSPYAVWPTYTHAAFTCPSESVITGLEANSGETSYRVRCSEIRDTNNNIMMVVSDPTWVRNPNNQSSCTDNKVLIGERFQHEQGEDNFPFHRCATVSYPSSTSTSTSIQPTP